MNCFKDGFDAWESSCGDCAAAWGALGLVNFPLISEQLSQHRFAHTSEDVLQRGVSALLTQLGVYYEREFKVSSRDRFDFLVAGGVVIEAKIKGSYAAAVTQVARYVEHPLVTGVILLTTSYTWPRGTVTMNTKPVMVVSVPRAFV